MNHTIILKFGGASVASPEAFSHISDIVIERKKHYQNVVVVVSAMGNTTNELIALAHKVNSNPPRREFDMLISVGERISISLLAMALAKKNVEAVSFTGSQTGIITTNENGDAKIIDVKPKRLLPCLAQGKVVIVAGFQGMSTDGDITTLGRGGSDTTAVALAVALGAEKVEFFKDVLGIYNEDPKKNPHAKLLPTLSYDEALKIILAGAKVLHARSVSMAQKNSIKLHVLCFTDYKNSNYGTVILSQTRLSEPEYKYEFK
ncbi:MAG: aspartate kinase [Bdellovibrionota bacterium]